MDSRQRFHASLDAATASLFVAFALVAAKHTLS